MGGRLEGKLAIVSGGARGIGEAIVREFVAEGARVILGDIRDQEGESLVSELGAAATYRRLDVTLEEDWLALVEALGDERVDVLVNNAGAVVSFDPLHETDLATWRSIIETNLTSVFLGMRHVIPLMRRHRSGSVINVSSISGIAGHDVAPAYQAAKGGIRVLTKNGAITYAKEGIRVNSLHPGIIATPMVAEQPQWATEAFVGATPMGRPGRPVDIAYAAVYLAGDESAFVTGAELVIDGGFLAQ